MIDQLIERLDYLSGGDDSFKSELIKIFTSETGKNIAALKEDVQQGNLENASRAAHAVKGACLNMGAGMLSKIAEELETQFDNGQINANKLEELQHLFSKTKIALDAYLSKLNV